ncbi:DUF305 domain-containing protein [Nocardia salmonicida]|uniref:Uncharacterized protein (DUF305 family) n=1 Tax=Nocardia fluminea TaxID=134984 RepID=A0A2N3VH66_9NOCA|nr:DUF305 domain-containing protein [Nocardia fluminea]PKV80953.1 uncharacterized protein (DUF305 family) [Nocardia fluminea]
MSRRSIMLRRLVPGVVLVALAVAGCGDDDSGGTAATSAPGLSPSSISATAAPVGTFNDADVTFLQMMYQHHQQAVQMADLVPSRSQDQQVIDLAADIKAAQAPEMAQMQSMLTEFGKSVPSGGDAMGHDMPGMMSPEQMSMLEGMSGPEFDRMWLEMMIDHHNGAVQMAQTEIASGANPQAKQMAETIVSTQQREIDQMTAMLGQR